DKGVSWRNISSTLPERGSAYAIEEDHVDPNLLFVGTEFGVFFSDNRGGEWKQLKGGVPTIAVRDIAIQEEHNDLVLGTFGRGFYVLDDYSSLRGLNPKLNSEATLFGVRDALQFEMAYPLGLPDKAFMGDNFYIGDNLGAEAIFTWYLKETIDSKEEKRKEAAKKLTKDAKNNPYPTYGTLKEEAEEMSPQLVFTISNSSGEIVRKLFTSPKKGLKRMHWDLRYATQEPISFRKPAFYNPFGGDSKGALVEPGTYTVGLSKIVGEIETQLSAPVSFKVIPLNNAVLPAADRQALAQFQQEVNDLSGQVSSVENSLSELADELKFMKEAIRLTPSKHVDLLKGWKALDQEMKAIRLILNGDRIARRLDQGTPPSISRRIGSLQYEQSSSTGAPTETHRRTYAIAKEEFEPVYVRAKDLVNNKFDAFRKKLKASGAPYTPGNIHFLE
ncbi:MAG: hypothetical protein KJO90_00725, partial [Eudoraea sp.]|nr:hypothetical protein [Eudoraea sp.]